MGLIVHTQLLCLQTQRDSNFIYAQQFLTLLCSLTLLCLWFDVEQGYKTIFDQHTVQSVWLWFDVEQGYKTMVSAVYRATELS